MDRSALLIFVLFSACSCGNQVQHAEENVQQELALVVKDSIQINYAGMLHLQDIDPDKERLLLYDQQREFFFITDLTGAVLYQIEKEEDGKGSYSYLLGPAQFHGEDEIFVVAMNGMLTFNFYGELVSHVPFTNEEQAGFSGRPLLAEEFFPYDGRYLGKGVFSWGEFGKNERQYYDDFLLLSWFDPEDGSFDRRINLHPESLLKSGKAYEVTEMMPAYTLFDNKIYVIVGTDPHLEIYEANEPYHLISRKRLQYDPYYPSDGQDMQVADPQVIQVIESSGFTKNLKATSQYLISGYFPGYDRTDRERLKDPAISGPEFQQSIKGKYPEYIHIMDQQGKLLSTEANHLNIDLRQFTVRGDDIWAKKMPNEEVEEDFIIIYRIAIE
ncbi:MAG TPA: hypothetical protein VK014_07905 [Cyclobacteriaceae bacterium]|nr:hypothetical protein [Cyclobacteriaceae bacterium]